MAVALLCGCSSPKPAGPRVDVTIGQQLIELKEAHDVGALNDKEYDRQRKQLIESIK
ncbi:MAG TPA: SHOCT domain-containing protein [Burkholderiales bacterium]|nr:SHOCT domain-containing protein [Burkholderiales bacterium]